MNSPRRKTLKTLLGLAGLPLAGSFLNACSHNDNERLLGASKYLTAAGDTQFALAITQTNAKPQLIPLGFFGHGLTEHPLQHGLFACFEKKGPGAALVDVLGQQKINDIQPSAGRHFYGHGQYAKNGEVIYVTETDLAKRDGIITIRDGRNGQLLGEFPSFGANPHDCLLVDDGKALAITNAGDAVGGKRAPCVNAGSQPIATSTPGIYCMKNKGWWWHLRHAMA